MRLPGRDKSHYGPYTSEGHDISTSPLDKKPYIGREEPRGRDTASLRDAEYRKKLEKQREKIAAENPALLKDHTPVSPESADSSEEDYIATVSKANQRVYICEVTGCKYAKQQGAVAVEMGGFLNEFKKLSAPAKLAVLNHAFKSLEEKHGRTAQEGMVTAVCHTIAWVEQDRLCVLVSNLGGITAAALIVSDTAAKAMTINQTHYLKDVMAKKDSEPQAKKEYERIRQAVEKVPFIRGWEQVDRKAWMKSGKLFYIPVGLTRGIGHFEKAEECGFSYENESDYKEFYLTKGQRPFVSVNCDGVREYKVNEQEMASIAARHQDHPELIPLALVNAAYNKGGCYSMNADATGFEGACENMISAVFEPGTEAVSVLVADGVGPDGGKIANPVAEYFHRTLEQSLRLYQSLATHVEERHFNALLTQLQVLDHDYKGDRDALT